MNKPQIPRSKYVKLAIHAAVQSAIYKPCPCGSGKKLKWCCYRTEKG